MHKGTPDVEVSPEKLVLGGMSMICFRARLVYIGRTKRYDKQPRFLYLRVDILLSEILSRSFWPRLSSACQCRACGYLR